MSTIEKSDYYIELAARLSKGITQHKDKPEESIDATLRALWHLAAGQHVSVERAHLLELSELSGKQIDNLEKYVDRRLHGVPLTHITNRQQFMDVEFIVGPEALVPRKETELLGYGALEILKNIVKKKGCARVIDVCTGAGNIALALAYHQCDAEIHAADLSSDAVEIAMRNNRYMKLDDRVSFYTGDLLEPFEHEEYYKKIDLLTCNPPYISSGKLKRMPVEIIGYEPDLAFDGGPFGIKILARLIKEAPMFLRNNGWLAFEVGLGQGEIIFKRLEKNQDYKEFIAIKNNDGDIRAIMAKVNHT